MDQPEILISNVHDGESKNRPEFKNWAESVAGYVCEALGPAPIVRVGAYHFGATVGVAIDCFALEDNERCITITTILSGNEMLLPNVQNCAGQLDVALPGILDALHLMAVLQNRTGGQIQVFTM
jgi:hypothetical protein